MKLVMLAVVWIAIGLVGCNDTAAPPTSTSQAAAAPAPPAESTPAAAPQTSKETAMADAPESSSTDKVVRTEAEWKKILTPDQYYVLREKGTERPFTNKYDEHFEPGVYECAACGAVLFSSETKFNSGCGWPAFYAAKAGDRVTLTPDNSFGMKRTEVTCTRCGSHLGHIFNDAPQTPTGQRYCINSVSLKFVPKSELKVDTPPAEEQK